MLSLEQHQEFNERGFVRLRGAFSPAEAARMEDRLWNALGHKHGVCRDDRATWQIPLGAGLQRMRTERVFDAIGGPALVGALDDLVGAERWAPPKHWGQWLVTFPTDGEAWSVPTRIWHTDFPYWMPTDRVAGVLVFSFLTEVPVRCGATLAIAGSPRLIRRFIEARPKLRQAKMKVARHALFASDPWLKALVSKDDPTGRVERFMTAGHAIEDIPVQVAELTGEPGDVILGHPWLLHCGAPNRGDQPRFMRVQRIRERS